jgi:glucose/arabinose dehydrogenase
MVFNLLIMRRAAGLLLGLIACLAAPAGAEAAVGLTPIGSFQFPVFVTSDPSDPDRLLVVEQQGRVLLLDGSQSTFVDLRDRVQAGGEQGLLSVALAPDYASSGRLYVFYTRRGDGALQIDELTASGDRAPLSSRRPVLTIPHPDAGNHNGGQLQFGPDGYLYIGTGDGGGQGDPAENAQSTESLLGKLLRIDPRAGGSAAYTVPAGNPFVGTAGRDEIWSLGLRNPWRFSFDRLTGDLLIGDVGDSQWEEIDFSPAPTAGRGVNFGWDCYEGPVQLEPSGCPAAGAFSFPIHAYSHSGGNTAIAGGYVVRDQGLEELYGRYVYADNTGNQLRSLVPRLPLAAGDRSEDRQIAYPSSFGEDACGRVYVVSFIGPIYRLGDGSPVPCVVGGGGGARGRESCAGKPATIVASARRLEGTKRADVIVGVAGRNVIRGGGGADVICGLAGNDRLRGGAGKDVLRGGHGADRCFGGRGRDRLRSC